MNNIFAENFLEKNKDVIEENILNHLYSGSILLDNFKSYVIYDFLVNNGAENYDIIKNYLKEENTDVSIILLENKELFIANGKNITEKNRFDGLYYDLNIKEISDRINSIFYALTFKIESFLGKLEEYVSEYTTDYINNLKYFIKNNLICGDSIKLYHFKNDTNFNVIDNVWCMPASNISLIDTSADYTFEAIVSIDSIDWVKTITSSCRRFLPKDNIYKQGLKYVFLNSGSTISIVDTYETNKNFPNTSYHHMICNRYYVIK